MERTATEELDRYAEARQMMMGRAELQEPDDGLSRRLTAALEERSIAPLDLEGMVNDALGVLGAASPEGPASRKAAAVNGGGLDVQVGFLMNVYGGEPLLNALREQHLRSASPSP